MAEQWYFERDDKRFGPFSTAQLKELAALGKLQPKDTVWKEGIGKGMPAGKVKNLFPTREATVLSANARVPAAHETQLRPQSSGSLPSLMANTAAMSGALPTSGDDHATPDGQLPQIIPDGLMLKVIPEDAAFPLSPAPIDSPGLEPSEERKPNTSSALTRSAQIKLKSVQKKLRRK